MKVCGHCKISKSRDAFWKRSSTKDGLQNWCIACLTEANVSHRSIPEVRERMRQKRQASYRANSEAEIKRYRDYRKANPEATALIQKKSIFKKKYGLTLEDYDCMLEDQGGVCLICATPPSSKNKYLHVDHDHESGEIRGLLCSKCNTGIGLFQDKPDLLVAAAAYLLRQASSIGVNA